ncbi:MAG: CCA tRNA nucleotidyltransferase [Croceibacterium sp.]
MTSLPAADWTQREDLALLVAALGAGQVRWVGGAVRDTLLGKDVSDIDAATLHKPADVVNLLEEACIRTIPTGIAHGTVTALLDSGNVEITTLRQDIATDGRRATVEFAHDWREDAARRDFTINALYAHPETLEIFDWFGGLDDLEAKRVRFIGDASARIREDHLRILRYYRFQARFGSEIDPEAESACAELAPMLKGLSRERVGWELQNLLALPDPSTTVARMFERGVLPVILPETGANELAALRSLIAEEQRQKVEPDALRRLAALLPAERRAAEQVASRLRLSTSQKKRLMAAAKREATPADPRALAYRLGREGALDRLLLTGSDIAALGGWDIPQLPLKGGEIVQRGVTAGPEVARILKEIEDRWVDEGFPGRARIDTWLNERLPS